MCGLTYSQNERVGPMAWKYIYVSVVPVSRRQNSIVQKLKFILKGLRTNGAQRKSLQGGSEKLCFC